MEILRAIHSVVGSVVHEPPVAQNCTGTNGVYTEDKGEKESNGGTLAHASVMTTATRRYTDFLLANAWSGSTHVSVVVASLCPCMRLYAFLGKELVKARQRAGKGEEERMEENEKEKTKEEEKERQRVEQQCSEWISTYSSEEFERQTCILEGVLDRLVEKEVERVEREKQEREEGEEGEGGLLSQCRDAYRYALECEREFFEAAWRSDTE